MINLQRYDGGIRIDSAQNGTFQGYGRTILDGLSVPFFVSCKKIEKIIKKAVDNKKKGCYTQIRC